MNNTTTYNRLIKKENPFTQILNIIITDSRISSNAFRLISYLISKPNDWVINLTEAYKSINIGRDAGARAFKELQSVGYLDRTQVRGKNGYLLGYNYILNENPSNLHNLPESGFQETSKPATTNTESISYNKRLTLDDMKLEILNLNKKYEADYKLTKAGKIVLSQYMISRLKSCISRVQQDELLKEIENILKESNSNSTASNAKAEAVKEEVKLYNGLTYEEFVGERGSVGWIERHKEFQHNTWRI